MLRTGLLALAAGLLLAACDEAPKTAGGPPPREPGAESVGYYCGMTVADHAGPKGQIFLEGRDEPLWFSSVRDTLAFTLLPEEPKAIVAIYVNDLARARDWDRPEPGTWVTARDAIYVAGSSLRGGMGGAEIVPFSERAAAERFVERHGGRIFRFGEIPDDYVLGAGDGPQLTEQSPAEGGQGDHDNH